jgi:hypothetical protein
MERKKRKDGKKKWWSADQRLQAAATYVMLGTTTETSLVTGIPLPTLKAWKTLPWWKDMVEQVRSDDLDLTSSSIQRVMKKALTIVEDRLDNGNFVLDQKTGRVIRVGVNLKDSLKATTELMAKQEALLNSQVHKQTQEATVDRLTKLAEELAKFAKAKPVPAIEGEFKTIKTPLEATNAPTVMSTPHQEA